MPGTSVSVAADLELSIINRFYIYAPIPTPGGKKQCRAFFKVANDRDLLEECV